MAPRKGSTVAFKDAACENGQFCNRIGCSGRLKYSPSPIGSSDKGKSSQSSFYSSTGNEITQNSCSSSPVIYSKKKMPSQSGSDPSEQEVPFNRNPTKYRTESYKKSGKFIMTEVKSTAASSNAGPPKVFQPKSGLHNQNTSAESSVPLVSKCSTLGPSSSNGRKYNLRSIKSNPIPNSKTISVKKNMMEKKSSETESSSSYRGRKPTSGISISESSCSDSREDKGTVTSVQARRPINMNTRMRLSYQQNGRSILSSRGPSVEIPDNTTPSNIDGQSLSRQFSSSGSSSYSLSSSNGDSLFTSSELGFTNLMNQNLLHQRNIDGITEVLLALERFAQNEELTHQQVLALETSLFLRDLNLFDQHREMRLDIDNMTYEELLALEEKMGTVSTALKEEDLSKCLRKSTYKTNMSKLQAMEFNKDGDDISCSICQEDYVKGDEIGRLIDCQHRYHDKCIVQWLRLKNWCPICKASAAPSQLSSSS